jgi:predicted amidohydrolase
VKVAIAQVIASTEKETNLKKAVKFITKAKHAGADFVIFPEIFMAFVPPNGDRKPAEMAEPLDGPFVTTLAEAAKANQIYVIGGMYEAIADNPERVHNTVFFLDRDGQLRKYYRKTHLYDAFAYKESSTTLPSTNPFTVVETEFGKIGLLICYELRFPEISRQLALQRADVLFLPAAWVSGPFKEDHWETLIRARAIENTVFVCASDQTGNIYCGRSMVVDPMGAVLASAGEEESLITADIDLSRVQRVRDKLPCLVHRRPELYV